MRVGIIGTGWGRIHIGTFRAAGADVQALVGTDPERVERVARDEGVPVGTTALDVLDDVDIVVVASPTATHPRLVERFLHKAVLCEKPLVGAGEISQGFAERVAGARVWVNYAFGFLATARRLRDAVGDPARVSRAHVRVATDLPSVASAEQALMEVAVHPLSLVFHLLGPFGAGARAGTADRATLTLHGAGRQLVVDIEPADRPGIDVDLAFAGPDLDVGVRGGYHPGEGWAFDPVALAGQPSGEPEKATDHGDIWYAANCRAVAELMRVLRGEVGADAARGRGLLHATDALAMERALVACR